MYWIFSFWKIFRFLFNCKTLMTLIDTLVFGAGVLSDSMSDTIVRFLQWCPSHIRGLMFPRCFLAWCHSLVFAVMSQSHGNILPGCCSLMPDSCSAITFWRPFSAEKSLPEDHFCIEDGVWNVVLWVMDSVVRLLQWCHSMMACLYNNVTGYYSEAILTSGSCRGVVVYNDCLSLAGVAIDNSVKLKSIPEMSACVNLWGI